ncbi:uncharacterized protein LOC132705876 isoform X2 [Cylas formicarius]|uniref:uncharacterized protein LOC132705876 isoform X2 n=1 Tax=Cylas formicarius TaxID=197179 RepID=UPI002958DBBE|nr:uncharacterized protein LOC132705876 isoform X2 [Cylas formicarius]
MKSDDQKERKLKVPHYSRIEKQESFVPTAPHISSSTTRQSAWLRKSTVIRDASATGPRDTMRKSRLGKLSSRARMVLGSIVDIKANIFGDTHDKKVARYMNTYRLEPDNPFNPEKVDKILREVLTEALENLTYDPEKCVAQAKWASMAIRSKVKALDFDRYKLVCIATIGEKISQDVYTTCRFLWDAEKDSGKVPVEIKSVESQFVQEM